LPPNCVRLVRAPRRAPEQSKNEEEASNATWMTLSPHNVTSDGRGDWTTGRLAERLLLPFRRRRFPFIPTLPRISVAFVALLCGFFFLLADHTPHARRPIPDGCWLRGEPSGTLGQAEGSAATHSLQPSSNASPPHAPHWPHQSTTPTGSEWRPTNERKRPQEKQAHQQQAVNRPTTRTPSSPSPTLTTTSTRQTPLLRPAGPGTCFALEHPFSPSD